MKEDKWIKNVLKERDLSFIEILNLVVGRRTEISINHIKRAKGLEYWAMAFGKWEVHCSRAPHGVGHFGCDCR